MLWQDYKLGGNTDHTDMIYVQQFLKVAAPWIFVEYATAVDRYRFCCSKCDATFTFYHGFGVQGEKVEWVLRRFVKRHQHTPAELKVATAKFDAAKEDVKKKMFGLLDEMKFKNPAEVMAKLTSSICECGESCPCPHHGFGLAKSPAPKQGRKFRQ